MTTAPASLLAAALALSTCAALAQNTPPPVATPFAIHRGVDGSMYFTVPLPAHTASQMQAAAEQRARDVDLGAASVWGTAQADWYLAQLRAAGLLPPSAPRAASAPEAAASAAPVPEAAASSAAQHETAPPPASVRRLGPGMDDDTLRHLIALFYESDTEKALQEKTYAFRRDTRRAMKDVLIIAASLYSLGQGHGVDWARLEATAQNLVDTHGPQITAIFLEGIKTAARARQNAASEQAAAVPPASAPASAASSAP